jgi:hypothetical protein
MKKYETARRLKSRVDEIRQCVHVTPLTNRSYTEDLISKVVRLLLSAWLRIPD